MGKLILLCGPAFSGKSTLAAALRERHGAAVVSLDELNARRGLDGGAGLAEAEWAQTFALALEEAGALLDAGRARVVVDDTLCFRFLRDRCRALAAARGCEARLLVLRVARAEVERRAAANRGAPVRGDVAPAVLARHLDSFEWPGEEERHFLVTGPGSLDALVASGWI